MTEAHAAVRQGEAHHIASPVVVESKKEIHDREKQVERVAMAGNKKRKRDYFKAFRAGSEVEKKMKAASEKRRDKLLYEAPPRHLLSQMSATKAIVAPITFIEKQIEKAIPAPILQLAEHEILNMIPIPGVRQAWNIFKALF
jgi:hypothetical protein